ncbi:MAG: peptidoglycan-binding protein [Planctomycetes bacterium]|nr:peptidoglycan-binding protein [Planctomycetota bacterium]
MSKSITMVWLAQGAALLSALLATAGPARGQSASEQRLLERLVIAEAQSEGELGMALVARSVLNRAALIETRTLSPGTYNARSRSIEGVILGNLQYEPVSNGSINRSRSAQQLAQARRAIALARDTEALDQALRADGVGPSARRRLIAATGFRTRSAYNDPSQNYGRQAYRNHVFNADRYSRRQDVPATFERVYGGGSGSSAAASRESRSPARQPLSATSATAARRERGTSATAAARRGSGTSATAAAGRERGTSVATTSGMREGGQPDTTVYRGPARQALDPGLARGNFGPGVGRLQAMLNKAGAEPPLAVDGLFGPLTQRALKDFQRKERLIVTGRLDAQTLQRLLAASPKADADPGGITAAQLRQIMPHVSAEHALLYVPHLNQAMLDAEITTRERRAAFLATLAHESAELALFEAGSSAPRALLASARQAFERMGRELGVDLAGAPQLLESPSLGFRVASGYWKRRGGNEVADGGDFRQVTLTVSGPIAGYATRLRYHTRAKAVLGAR